jgi:GT2 family glycosyltransferase
MTRTAVVVVTYNSSRDVEACFGSLERALGSSSAVPVLAVDSGSTDDTVERIERRFPRVELLRLEGHPGFARAANHGLCSALDRGVEFVYLLNPDTEVAPDFLARALEVAEREPGVAAVQSLLLLPPAGELVDTAGNTLHFLGFGYCGLHRRSVALAPDRPVEISFASGAGVLLRAAALRRVGLFDESFFLYCEDLDLGWRLRLAGERSFLAPASRVVHRHEFRRNPEKFFRLERNRWLALLKNFSTRSLIVLAPLLALDELALALIALAQGWGGQKVRAWGSLLATETRRELRASRRAVQALRRVPDREIARWMSGRMEFDGVEPALLRWFANPILGGLWRLVRPLL